MPFSIFDATLLSLSAFAIIIAAISRRRRHAFHCHIAVFILSPLPPVSASFAICVALCRQRAPAYREKVRKHAQRVMRDARDAGAARGAAMPPFSSPFFSHAAIDYFRHTPLSALISIISFFQMLPLHCHADVAAYFHIISITLLFCFSICARHGAPC
jgi:hypothetical protein